MSNHEVTFDVDGVIRVFRESHPGIPEDAEVSYVPPGKYPAALSFKWKTPEPSLERLTPLPPKMVTMSTPSLRPESKLVRIRDLEANE